MVKPSCSDNIFIASGSFTSLRFLGWSEGSLEAVDEVLNKKLFQEMKLQQIQDLRKQLYRRK
ncbi:hypothetical protein KUTeg_024469 [Tegillarca granosa]|uniref:Uncharacterized protein n=1 Tax=Tegillarca granosa TaxID=220873 RepID=A0ABQ9DXF3_TEGGR|nr:hypothetical protein KUTeg_024469 [Tegillarca granosa]